MWKHVYFVVLFPVTRSLCLNPLYEELLQCVFHGMDEFAASFLSNFTVQEQLQLLLMEVHMYRCQPCWTTGARHETASRLSETTSRPLLSRSMRPKQPSYQLGEGLYSKLAPVLMPLPAAVWRHSRRARSTWSGTCAWTPSSPQTACPRPWCAAPCCL